MLVSTFFQNISCADVADICVKALHDSTARNKSFDVRFVFLYVFYSTLKFI